VDALLDRGFAVHAINPADGRVARPFGFALTDPGRRFSRTRLFPEVTRIEPLGVSRGV
jgi:hypothetical protein